MTKEVTGQVERTPDGDTPYAVFFLLDDAIIGEVAVHTLEEGEAIVRNALEYLELIGREPLA